MYSFILLLHVFAVGPVISLDRPLRGRGAPALAFHQQNEINIFNAFQYIFAVCMQNKPNVIFAFPYNTCVLW